MKKSFVNMAFSKGVESKEVEFKLYTGVGTVQVVAVNPTKDKLEAIYGRTFDNDPAYVSEVTVGEGNKVLNARIDFIIKTVADKCDGIDYVTKMPFFIQKEYRYNRDKTKVQVIDKYGRTAWVTVEQAKNHEIPMYSNGPANIDKDYRPCYVGEEDLTEFIKTYLRIPNVMKYVREENKWVMVEHPEECEARLDNIEKYFKGDFSEVKQAIALQPINKVKVLFGVRTTDDNKQYQTVLTQMVLRSSVNDYSKLDAFIQERKNNGAYNNIEFSNGNTIENIKEYKVEATDFSNTNTNNSIAEGAGVPWDFSD